MNQSIGELYKNKNLIDVHEIFENVLFQNILSNIKQTIKINMLIK